MKDVLTLPNAITLSRILAIPILIMLFFWGPLWLFYAVLALGRWRAPSARSLPWESF
jgi:phosphatidylglycerophosphate synthase